MYRAQHSTSWNEIMHLPLLGNLPIIGDFPLFTLVIRGQIIMIMVTENFEVERMLMPVSESLSGSKS
jgi:hypothetical protein